MSEKLKSRKLLVAVGGVVLAAANRRWNLGMSEQEVWSVASVVVGYVLGQGAVDVVQALGGGRSGRRRPKKRTKPTG